MTTELDAIDRQILSELTRDGRMSVTAVAEAAHISRANAYARITRLTQEGVIQRFSAIIDPEKSGLRASAYVTLNVRQDSWRELRQQLTMIPEVQHIALVGGEFDVLLLVRATDNADLRRIVFSVLQPIAGVISTRTLLIFDDVDAR
ncbi:Lrp/AsnC family transcriptional regulator [Homoserinimonas sp. OAct 916]|uniref:Lrp/AsnC family transcriptional regulator n=1 Tax=Homoserinimonas sp. OAct 916 TaxID=2211450 RepID=UPI001E2BEE51|nr:Lrp/AsnC family transcriptional regulator [Homoserinimonas sp. OAct 916]